MILKVRLAASSRLFRISLNDFFSSKSWYGKKWNVLTQDDKDFLDGYALAYGVDLSVTVSSRDWTNSPKPWVEVVR